MLSPRLLPRHKWLGLCTLPNDTSCGINGCVWLGQHGHIRRLDNTYAYGIIQPMSKFTSTLIRSLALLPVIGPVGAFVSSFLFGSTWVWGAIGGFAFCLLLAAVRGGNTGTGAAPAGGDDHEPVANGEDHIYDGYTDTTQAYLNVNINHSDD